MPLQTPILRFDKREITPSAVAGKFKISCRYYYWDGHARRYHQEMVDEVLPEDIATASATLDTSASDWLDTQTG